MKIQVLSDLHLEFMDFTPVETDADVVVLAGDIHTKTQGIAWAVKHFSGKPVIYVPGNHEYYAGSLGRTVAKLRECALGTNVHVLDNESITLEGVRFVGGTLWTDYGLTGNVPLASWDAQQGMRDFQLIRDELFRRLLPPKLAALHALTRQCISETLEVPFEGPTVVVSHHAPSGLSISQDFITTKGHLSAAYASRLEYLMEGATLWVHGHTHYSWDYSVGDTRVVCNPRGYAPAHQNPDFNPALVIAV